ncbi:MAG: YegS/Rv2252/BmrU family lipid kinase [Lachnospiraceae bacterium]|nr:YegS/Rv2252/BmrU family lipid kinase [Lachnospiraceae bacterium]
MKDRKLLFVYNPMAGMEMIKTRLGRIVQTFTDAGFIVTTCATDGKGDATEYIKNMGMDYDLIVSSGGDGTLNETVKGLLALPEKKKCGYIPAGTVNDFATSLKIPKNMYKAAQMAVSERYFQCDIGRLNDKIFCYVAAFGAFTNVSYTTSQELKNSIGKFAYFWEALNQVGEIEPHHVVIEHDGIREEANIILGLISNSESIGGIKAYDKGDVNMDDGLLEVALIKELKTAFDLQNVLNAILTKSYNSEFLIKFNCASLKLTSDSEIAWTVDGEDAGSYTDIDIGIYERAVDIACKQKNKKPKKIKLKEK